MSARRLILLGPPGSGKGTQARRISERFGHVAISSGDIFRAEIAAESAIGREAAGFVQQGRLVPDLTVIRIMLAGIERLGPDALFVLDGFPRTVPQAEGLRDGMRRLELSIDAVIDFRIADEIIVQRAINRRICKNCGRSYNVRFFPPRVAEVCDQCGGPVCQRDDDREDVIRTRLETYRNQTAPLVDYYTNAGLLRWVDAAGAAERVEASVAEIVESC